MAKHEDRIVAGNKSLTAGEVDLRCWSPQRSVPNPDFRTLVLNGVASLTQLASASVRPGCRLPSWPGSKELLSQAGSTLSAVCVCVCVAFRRPSGDAAAQESGT